MADVQLLQRSNKLEPLRRAAQDYDPENLKIYELKYEVETTLNRVSYEYEQASEKASESE